MKYPRIYQQVMFEPWHIRQEAMRSIVDLLHSRINGESMKPHPVTQEVLANRNGDDVEFDWFGEPIPRMTVENGIATIPVHGVMIHKATMLDKSCGAVGMQDVRADLESALERSDVRAVMLDIDSPGGMALGTPELAMSAKSVNEVKPVFAFTDGLMCSAAYYLAATARTIYATPSSQVGSIGTIAAILDVSRMYDEHGVKLERFQSGTLKGAGMAGLPLSSEEKEYFQSKVDKASAMFFEWVREGRKPETVDQLVFDTGAYWMAEEAKGYGLVDGVHPDMISARSVILETLQNS